MITADFATPPPTGWSVLREVQEYYAPPTSADQTISTVIDDIVAFREGRDEIPGAQMSNIVSPEGGAYRMMDKTKSNPVADFDAMYARPTPKRRYARTRT